MKTISATSRKTKRRVPPLPVALRRVALDVLTVELARRIIKSHAGRPATAAELRQLTAANLGGLPST